MADDLQTTSALPASEMAALPANDTVALDAGEEVAALSSGTDDLTDDDLSDDEDIAGRLEVMSADQMSGQVQDAEAFGESLLSLQNVIRRYSIQQDDLSKKIKEIRESLRNMFQNDEELQKLEAQQKTANTDVKQKKQRIKESPEAVQLQMKSKEMQEEMNEMQQSMSNHLLRYYQMTGSQVIEDEDGTEREFSVKARLKGKKREA